jgi:2-keto-4-pentenoate hydratase
MGGDEFLARTLSDARKAKAVAAIEHHDLPATLTGAYAVALRQVTTIDGWKIGGANPWSKAAIGNTEIFAGPLVPDEVVRSNEAIAVSHLVGPLAEPEIVLELGDCDRPGATPAFARMGLGIEIPSSVLPEPLKSTVIGQVSDRAGAGVLKVGALQAFSADVLSQEFEIAFQHNDAAPVVGTSCSVFGGPLGAAMEMLRLAKVYGWPLRSGQLVATGGLCRAVAIKPGDHFRFEALQSELNLTVC